MNSQTTLATNRQVDAANRPSSPAERAVDAHARVPDYVVDVSRPVQPWSWTRVLLAPLELLAVVWSVPFLILAVSIPAVLVVALIYQLGRLVVGYF
jgi:hypothetical protein